MEECFTLQLNTHHFHVNLLLIVSTSINLHTSRPSLNKADGIPHNGLITFFDLPMYLEFLTPTKIFRALWNLCFLDIRYMSNSFFDVSTCSSPWRERETGCDFWMRCVTGSSCLAESGNATESRSANGVCKSSQLTFWCRWRVYIQKYTLNLLLPLFPQSLPSLP